MITATVVHLDKVKVPVEEIEFAVLFLMSGKTYAQAPRMTATTAAGIVASIVIDARFQSQHVDIVHQRAHTIGKEFGVQAQVSIVATTVPIAIIDVYIQVACLLQSILVHGIGLSLNQILVDVQCERVPRTPAHRRSPLGKSNCCQAGQHCQDHCSTHSDHYFFKVSVSSIYSFRLVSKGRKKKRKSQIINFVYPLKIVILTFQNYFHDVII